MFLEDHTSSDIFELKDIAKNSNSGPHRNFNYTSIQIWDSTVAEYKVTQCVHASDSLTQELQTLKTKK